MTNVKFFITILIRVRYWIIGYPARSFLMRYDGIPISLAINTFFKFYKWHALLYEKSRCCCISYNWLPFIICKYKVYMNMYMYMYEVKHEICLTVAGRVGGLYIVDYYTIYSISLFVTSVRRVRVRETVLFFLSLN